MASQLPAPARFHELSLAAAGAIPAPIQVALATAAGTYTLPSIAVLPDGFGIWVKNTSGGSVTVSAAVGSTDVVPAGYTTLTSGQAELLMSTKFAGTPYNWVGLVKPN